MAICVNLSGHGLGRCLFRRLVRLVVRVVRFIDAGDYSGQCARRQGLQRGAVAPSRRVSRTGRRARKHTTSLGAVTHGAGVFIACSPVIAAGSNQGDLPPAWEAAFGVGRRLSRLAPGPAAPCRAVHPGTRRKE